MSRKPLSFHEIQSESGLVIGSGSKAAGHRSRQRELDIGKGHQPVAAFVGTRWSLVSWQLIGPCIRLRKGSPPPQCSFVPSVNCSCLELGLKNRRVWFRNEARRRAKIRSLRLCLHEAQGCHDVQAACLTRRLEKEGSKCKFRQTEIEVGVTVRIPDSECCQMSNRKCTTRVHAVEH